MTRPAKLYASVRAELDRRRSASSQQPGNARRRRRDLDPSAFAEFVSGPFAAALAAAAASDGTTTGQDNRRSTSLNDVVSLTPDNARVLRVLHGSMDYSNPSPGVFYVELVPGATSTLPGTLVQYTPAGTRTKVDSIQIQVLNDEGEPAIWFGTVNGSNEFEGYTISIDQIAQEVNLNAWTAGAPFKAGVWPSVAAFPLNLIVTITATDVYAGTDQDGTLGSVPNTKGPGLCGFAGLGGNEQVAYFAIQDT